MTPSLDADHLAVLSSGRQSSMPRRRVNAPGPDTEVCSPCR